MEKGYKEGSSTFSKMIASPPPPSDWMPFSVTFDDGSASAGPGLSGEGGEPGFVPFQCPFVARLEHWRRVFLAATEPEPEADAGRLFHLLEAAGRCLAVVRFMEIYPPETGGARAGMWRLPDGEILFGTAPLSNRRYWRRLVEFTRRLAQSGSAHCRLVMFAAEDDPENAALRAMEERDGGVLEILTPSRAERATLLAASEVLREARDQAGPETNAAAAFRSLAPRTAFLWRRLTRPCREAGFPGERFDARRPSVRPL